MPALTTTAERIIRQPALTMPGNATGAEAACTSLTASQIRTLLSLATTSDVTFDIVRATTSVQTPLVSNAAALTLGNSTHGVTVPGPATFSGSITGYSTNPYLLLESTTTGAPYVKLKNTAAERRVVLDSLGGLGVENTATSTNIGYWRANGYLGLGNFYAGLEPTAQFQTSHGIAIGYAPGTSPTVPTGGIVAAGDISMSKTSAQGYIYAYNTAGTSYARMYNTGTVSYIESTGYLNLKTGLGGVEVYSPGLDAVLFVTNSSGATYMTIGNSSITTNAASLSIQNAVVSLEATTTTRCYKSGTNSTFRVYDSSVSKYSQLTHDGTNGILSTSSGNLNLVPAGGTVAVTGAVTASGNVSYAQGLSTGTVTKSANYTTTADDYRVNVTTNSIDITFETAVGCANREHEVINSGSGVVTLKTTSAQTISGSASGALTLAQWKSIRVVSDGANWLIMSQIT